MQMPILDPAALHPTLWRGDQLARGATRTVSSGYAALDAELPGGGWPNGETTDIHVQQHGIGEMRLLRPALTAVGHRPLMMLCAPHVPNSLAFANWGVPTENLYWIDAQTTGDALWTAEQILRAGTCGALLFWRTEIRPEHVRRLQLAAQAGDTLFFLFRWGSALHHNSPAPLRLSLSPAPEGADVQIVKRRGPALDDPIRIRLAPAPACVREFVPSQPLPSYEPQETR
ncbi:translesion DNA synthesis-associated protein ImuA [Chitinasiproducens palmae]|uniref:Cell division inhibitor SulA/protein ImuA n=1 Tax=Chitinasiproducens palmae TaxID=1770053 RepID=A0A1H2PVE9_9BURK|nr:cell division inhibitor SulA/protein ImuA [Chitinasiproducens palmae]